ncbi:GNAT family N-acetyltransferase [Pararhizobium antarcticum]|uniref:GNAT family acetyltransferase n=1 Tax=Pararhizobium antarcticum TaxID=1798805 RepID=A0A657LQ36_9HYPH|nr:GNAT family N-acetyltransferase [Pararhizobium antarcticum]OJF93636.1 GNAT family acetyltransferase [Rhizobium sp. 58]OJF95015.1 GNAT family acetyltransferase [Pararhizobium antarcticum]
MTIEIRDVRPGDEAEWRRLWAAYVAFYKVAVSDEVTAATWAKVMDPAVPLFMRVATENGAVRGFANCLIHEATWVKEPVCYLEDLFLDEASRGKGIGRALLDDLVSLAKAKGWARLYWHTDEGNSTARRLYDHYTKEDGHVRYRISF